MKAYAIQRPDGSVIVDTQLGSERDAWETAEVVDDNYERNLRELGYRLVEVEITVVTG